MRTPRSEDKLQEPRRWFLARGVLAALLVLVSAPASAAIASSGALPADVFVGAIAIDPSHSATLYVGTTRQSPFPLYSCSQDVGGRVFKSTSGGASWTEISSGLEGGSVNTLTFDRSTGTLYAATACGIFRTNNGGASWNAINSGLPAGVNGGDAVVGMTDLLVDPSNPSTLYALSAAGFPVGELGNGVNKTTNGGANWAPMNSGLPTDRGSASALAIDPTNPTTLYVGVSFAGVFKTTNAGASWSNTGLQLEQPDSDVPSALAIDPTNSATVYAIIINGGGNGVWKTTDGGAHWSFVFDARDHFIDSLAIDPTNSETLYAGDGNGASPCGTPGLNLPCPRVYKSTDGAASFVAVGPDLPTKALAIDPENPATVYAGGAGLLKTTDGGATWSSLVSPPPPPGPCRKDKQTLCLSGRRFSVTAMWANQFANTSGVAVAIPSTDSTGFFYFTDPSNYELVVKILNFGGVVKVFYSELTNLHFTISVTDTTTGTVKNYSNTPGDCGAIDENGFLAVVDKEDSVQSASPLARRGSCTPGPATLCLLNRRFSVTVNWMNQFNGSSGGGTPRSLSDLSGLFSFTDPSDVELVMKMVAFTDRVAFFYGALSNFEYDIAVTDTLGGTTKTYHNPAGNYCGGLDNNAFPP